MQTSVSKPEKREITVQTSVSEPEKREIAVQTSVSEPEKREITVQTSVSEPEKREITVQTSTVTEEVRVPYQVFEPPSSPEVLQFLKTTLDNMEATEAYLSKPLVGLSKAAQWLAYAHPCQRFAEALTGNGA